MSEVDSVENEDVILEMYRYAYPELSDLALLQLIDLEAIDCLSKMATMNKAANNGFQPELMEKIRERLNEWMLHHNPFKLLDFSSDVED